MKRVIILVSILFLLLPFIAAAQTVLVEEGFTNSANWNAAAGDWKVRSGSFVQLDTKAGMARADRRVVQSGVMEYQFDVRYVDGGTQDYHGGFGIHIAVQNPAKAKAWGNGQSYLLWLNYDTRDVTKQKYPQHYGFRAQVYKSESSSRMQLLDRYNLSIPLELVKMDYLKMTFPVRLVVDTNTGLVKAYDPTDSSYYYYFYLDPADLKGSYISFRTNGVSISFDNFKATKVQ